MNNHIGYCPTIRWGELTDAEREEIIRELVRLSDEYREGI